jgi:hypothetical protein
MTLNWIWLALSIAAAVLGSYTIGRRDGAQAQASQVRELERDVEEMKQRFMRACGRHAPVPIGSSIGDPADPRDPRVAP